jgi:hypothetical protein
VVAERCRQLAGAEPLAGSAPHRVAWLIIEEPGAWPRDALFESSVNELPEIASVAREANVGVLLMRHDRRTRPVRRVYLANRDELRSGHIHQLSEVLAWDWQRLADGQLPDFGEPQASLTLVCVQGTRDQCCAIDGRALLRAFANDPTVVECSHIGGHRFAPVVLHLPSGYLYGRASTHDVTRIIDGEVIPAIFRGCTYDASPIQVAEQWIRHQDSFTPQSTVSAGSCVIGDTQATVSLVIDSTEIAIHLRRTAVEPRPESCGAAPAAGETWTVIQ